MCAISFTHKFTSDGLCKIIKIFLKKTNLRAHYSLKIKEKLIIYNGCDIFSDSISSFKNLREKKLSFFIKPPIAEFDTGKSLTLGKVRLPQII